VTHKYVFKMLSFSSASEEFMIRVWRLFDQNGFQYPGQTVAIVF